MEPIIQNPLSWMYFPTALLLGALHALEPGHAKTLTAAYLIGIKGTKRDAFLLGLSVALTHSIVVIAISAIALFIGRESFTQDVSHFLQIGSGIIVIFLGAWLLVRRIIQMRKANSETYQHHESEPITISSQLAPGQLEIVQTESGEKIRYWCLAAPRDLKIKVYINRENGIEVLELHRMGEAKIFQSTSAPAEPHEFSAELKMIYGDQRETHTFEMHEPEGHDHHLMSDDEHARAHAASIPDYAKNGERPTIWQILSFGAAGGMIPCPASITVMLLALSVGKFGSGLFAVAGFSLGLAITLVGIGLVIVAGISKLQGSGRFYWVSKNAPIISAAVVMLSGVAALVFAH